MEELINYLNRRERTFNVAQTVLRGLPTIPTRIGHYDTFPETYCLLQFSQTDSSSGLVH
jgi:hypothetical protein